MPLLRHTLESLRWEVAQSSLRLAGCFGLPVAVTDLLPDLADPIQDALDGVNANTTPWDAE